MNALITIFNLIGGITGAFPTTLDMALKLKALLSVDGSDFTVQITAIRQGALASVEETDRIIAAWEAAHPTPPKQA